MMMMMMIIIIIIIIATICLSNSEPFYEIPNKK